MRNRSSGTRKGFTIIELMVVLGVIGILMSLLLPALQQAREAARRAACRNHLKQLALALHGYEGVHNVFPPGEIGAFGWNSPCGDPEEVEVEDNPGQCTEYSSWGIVTLPFMEQSVLHSQFDSNRPWSDLVNRTVVSTRLDLHVCPSSIGDRVDRHFVRGAAVTDYGAVYLVMPNVFTDVFGLPDPGLRSRLGMLAEHEATGHQAVTDGLSHTILLTESAGRPTPFVLGHPMTADEFLSYSDDEEQVVVIDGEFVMEDGIGWADPDSGFEVRGVHANGVDPYGPNFINASNTGEVFSFHHGGAHVALGDGSVRFLSESIDGQLFVSLCTRSGNEVLGEF